MAVLAKDLRDALLQSAIQGKITKTLKSDTPVSQTISYFRNEKEKLLKSKNMKDRNSFEPITENEHYFDIPDSWDWVRINDIGVYKKGPFGSALTKSMFVRKSNTAVKVYEQKNAIQKNEKLGEYYISKDYYESKMTGFTIEGGDIIVSCAGTIGETFIMPDEIEVGIINQALMRMNVVESINTKYFMLVFDHILKSEARNKSGGTAIKNIPPFEVFKAMPIPLPPIEEQERIVLRVEELMAKIDEYEKIENQLVDLQKKFPGEMKEALLLAALQGKLTQSNEDDSYANELLLEIDKYKNDNVTAKKIKDRELLPITLEDEESFELKPKWCLTRLGNLCTIIFMGKSPVYEKKKNDYLCIGQKNNQNTGFTKNGIKYVTKDFWESVPEYQHLRKNDVLLNTLGGGTVGRSGIYTIDDDAITDGHVMVIRFKDEATAKYVLSYLQFHRSIIEDSANGSTNQKFINLYDVKNYLIPLPPLSEQKRIVEKLEKLMNICDSLNSL